MTASKPAAAAKATDKVAAKDAVVSRKAAAPNASVASAPVPASVVLLRELLNPPAVDPVPTVTPPASRPPKESQPAPAKAPKLEKRSRFKFRHTAMALSFVACVFVPGLIASIYMLFIANDQYHSSASFAVRSIESSSPTDVIGMFTQASSGSTSSDSYILMDYIRSDQMVKLVDAEFGLETIYARRGLDFYYSLAQGSPIETKLDFWRSIADVSYDNTSGIVDLQIRAFDPVQARRIASFVISASEKLVNDLSGEARKGVLESAHEEVFIAERRLSAARIALLAYRDRAQEVDPTEGAKMAAQLINSLELQLVQLNSDLATARSQMSDNSPRVRVLKNQIASLEEQIRLERTRVGSGLAATSKTRREDRGTDVANRIAEYETLETEREFSERAYSAALTSLEKARIDANNRQRYLAVFLKPTESEWAQYPARIFYSLLVCGMLLFFWSMAVMGYYNLRDRN